MSTQSIIHNTNQKIDKQVTDYVIEQADNYFKNKYFGVGEKVCLKKLHTIIWLKNILCSQDCMLRKYDSQLKEKLNLLTIK